MITAAVRAANRQRELIGKTYRECPICASLHLEYEFLVEKSPVCGCQTCGLRFLNPAPEDIGAEEESDQLQEDAADELIRELLSYSGVRTGRLLLMGGSDSLAAKARLRGFEAISLSMNDLNSGVALLERIDLCVLSCSLDKVRDPVAVLRSIRSIISDHGALLIVSPTIDGKPPRFNRRNRFYFSIDTLQNLVVKTGFGDALIMPSQTRTIFMVKPKRARPVPLLSVIVPVYNEQPTFIQMMEQLLLKSIDGVEIEIIIVESNSTDGTRETVQSYVNQPRVKVILQDKPMGKGNAVRAGLALAEGDIILFQDGDLEYDLNDYDALVAPILRFESNFILGSRHNAAKTSWKIRKFTDSAALAAYFNLGHVLFLALFNFVYKQELTDPFTMYKVFRRDCIWGLTFECNRFDFDNEIVIKLVRKGYRPLELPVNYASRSIKEGKKLRLVRDAIYWLRALIKFRKTPLYGIH